MENLSEQHHLKVETGSASRLDIFLHQFFAQFSRSFLQKTIRQGKVTVNNKVVHKPSHLLKSGDEVDIVISFSKAEVPAADFLPLNIVFEDQFLIVVNKPGGMTTHPVYPEQRGTLVNALLHYTGNLSQVGGTLRPGIVHRLDKDTSGLMLVAKTDSAHVSLTDQFKKREIKKKYVALVQGKPAISEGTINLKIGRHPTRRTKMIAGVEGTRDALTFYKTLKSWKSWSLLEVHPLTGRMHQIRVHLKSLHCFILGDSLYGGKPGKQFPIPVDRCMLHSKFIGFLHPQIKKWMEFEVPIPQDMETIISYLERNYAVT